MNYYELIEQIDDRLDNLCGYDNLNEVLRLQELKKETEEKINKLFKL
jgi:hypothetical protein